MFAKAISPKTEGAPLPCIVLLAHIHDETLGQDGRKNETSKTLNFVHSSEESQTPEKQEKQPTLRERDHMPVP